MLYAKISTDKTVTFGPVLAADGTMSSGALAYTDAKIFKNGTDGALDASATFTHKYEGVYALLLKAADLNAVGCYEVVLNKSPLSAAPVKITVLAANVYDWLFGTTAPSTLTQTQVSGGAYDLTNATYVAALKSALGTVPAQLARAREVVRAAHPALHDARGHAAFLLPVSGSCSPHGHPVGDGRVAFDFLSRAVTTPPG